MGLVSQVISENHLIKGSCDLRVRAVMVSEHLAKSNGNRHCGVGDVMVLVRQMILQDHVLEGLHKFMGGSPSW